MIIFPSFIINNPQMYQNSKLAFLVIVMIFITSNLAEPTPVSFDKILTFFNHTLDPNQDGSATLDQFIRYYTLMESQNPQIIASTKQTFQILDQNRDSVVTIQQIAGLHLVNLNPWKQGHQQVHISLTENDDQMQVIWVSNPTTYQKPYVLYGRYPTQLNMRAYATMNTYDVGHVGFQGKIYRAIMRGLKHNTKYYYKVGDQKTKTFSSIKHFTSPPQKDQQLKKIRFATMGDVGTFAPFGHMTLSQIARDNFENPYDFVWLTGDIAYAGVSSEKAGQIEPIWDIFGQLSQPFAAYTPFMAGVGNHQKYYNYSAYTNRYRLPKKTHDQPNFWFSFDYGQLHIAYFSSQASFHEGSEQYRFLQEDLRAARNNPNTKWIFVGTHRPFYSSNQRQFSNDTSLAQNLEQLFKKYQVDIVQNGHIHSYQRSWPVFRGKVLKEGHSEDKFINPKAPIYVVQATGGAMLYRHWVDPIPQWSIKQILKYGYGEVIIEGGNLKYNFINAMNGKVIDSWEIQKQ